MTLIAVGQGSGENAYLFRKHIDKDSIWSVPNTGCYYMTKTGMKENSSGWFQLQDLQSEETDLFYFEATTFGSVRLVIELHPESQVINFDTISNLNYQLINHFYAYARTDFPRKTIP